MEITIVHRGYIGFRVSASHWNFHSAGSLGIMLCDKVSTKAPEGTSPNSCLASMTNYVEFRVGIIGRAQTPVALNPSNRKSHGKQVENEMEAGYSRAKNLEMGRLSN